MSHFAALLRPALLAAGSALLLNTAGYAQSAPPAPASVGSLTLKVMPLALADPTTPTFRFGAEYHLSPLWGVEASYGLQMRNLGWGTMADLPNNRYHKVHAEVRHYVGGSPLYVAAAGFRVQQQFDLGAGTMFENGQTYSYSSARVHRAITAGLLKMGVVMPLDAHWRLDVAVGAGMRYGRIRYRTQELAVLSPTDYGWYREDCRLGPDWNPTTTPGTFRRATLAFDVKLGYCLGR